MIPMQFWMQARDELDRKYGHTLWLAESADASFERELTQVGVPFSSEIALFAAFDLCYDYGIYPDLRDLHAGNLALPEYLAAKQARLQSVPAGHGFAHFLENNDHDRTAAYIDPDLLPAWLALTMLSPGSAIIYAGQELGLTHTPSLFEPDPVPPATGPTVAATGIAPDLPTRLAAARGGARQEMIVIRALGSTAVAVEWGVRRRSSVILDLTVRNVRMIHGRAFPVSSRHDAGTSRTRHSPPVYRWWHIR